MSALNATRKADYTGATSMYLFDCPYCVLPVWVGHGTKAEHLFFDDRMLLSIVHRSRLDHFLLCATKIDENDNDDNRNDNGCNGGSIIPSHPPDTIFRHELGLPFFARGHR